MTVKKLVHLSDMCHGALEEVFQVELNSVIKNIRDPNYPAKSSRKITVSLEFKPDDSRSLAQLIVSTSTKLATTKPLETNMLFSSDEKGSLTVNEHMPVNNDNLTMPFIFEVNGA